MHPLLDGHPAIDRFHILRRGELEGGPRRALAEIWRISREIREEGYEVVLDFHGRLKSGVLSRLTGVSHRVGYGRGDSTEANWLFSNVHVKLEDHWENRVLRFLHLLAPLGIDTDYDPAANGMHLKATDRAKAVAWYEGARRPELAVYPGTSLARAAERWPPDKWVELLSRLGDEEIRSAVFWGPAEEDLSRQIAERAGESCKLAPPTTLKEMLATIGCFRAFVGSDTAAMHMAWMQGVPTGVFIGPKPPRTIAPLEPVPSRVLRADEHYREGVKPSRQPPEIVSEVSVEEALAAARYLLSRGRADG